MFVLGFTMESTLNVAYQLLNKSQSPLKFVLTYKMSQDHLEHLEMAQITTLIQCSLITP